ncbi:NADH:flavin oxidoreductase [Herbiconiux moechotypicola]|uniref:FAD-dependent oxidoreductase n=1 Tax=Herbiconiux moechotypicola TaxID=637393 RepID=A0ABP5Q818_9MICO|nr:NADH:flavin oxidoreductase [Herbiconiux moechotypicola]MCS5729173.1 NADH:flavin oxidoreductase [Herbiconiux moechotypicola]
MTLIDRDRSTGTRGVLGGPGGGDGSSLEVLYTPARIGRLTLKNRFIQSPMHSKFSSEFGEVSDKLTDYLVERAKGGAAMIILENTAVDWARGRAAGNPVRIDDDLFVAGLSDLTEAVHREGAMIATQLHHAGRQCSTANTEGGVGALAPSAITSTAIGDEPHAMTHEQIAEVVQQFRDAARRSVMAGFDMIEIHGSHGYLLTQFLSPQANHRTDEYGGSFENRARFPLEVVRAVREEIGPDFPLSYRISLEERVEGGMEADDGLAFCTLIEPYVDVFNVTAATYESMDSIFMMQGREPGELLPLAARVKAIVGKPVVGISRLGWILDAAADSVAAGEMDFVAMGRTQLTDAKLILKVKNGESDRARRCIGCNECVGTFLFGGWRLHCVMNPELGYEREANALLRPQFGATRKRVVVIGGGPAGAEAARAAALRGHDVQLFEARDRIGGQVLTASAADYKKREMEAYVTYFERELEHVGVRVHTGAALGADHPALVDADVVVVATGARVSAAGEPGALDAVEVMRTGSPLSGEVLVQGANEIALNAAAYAAQQGAQVTVVTGERAAGYDMNPILAAHTVQLLERAGVRIVADAGAAAVEASTTTLWAPDWVADPEPVAGLEWLAGLPGSVEVVEVGARVKGGRLYQATQSGFWAGTRI